jgi:hypothetical protein
LILCGENFENNLIQFLKIYFSEEEVQSVILQYRLGTSKHWLVQQFLADQSSQ